MRKHHAAISLAATSGLLALLGAAPAAAAQPAAAQPAAAQPATALSPSPSSTNNTLKAVSSDSATDAWAVGWYTSDSTGLDTTLALHWNGTAWSQVATPNPGPDGSYLVDVSAVSPTDAWAVGEEQNGDSDSPATTVILHWNGTAWSQVPNPDPGSLSNNLAAVTAVSATRAWAVGSYSDSATATDALILRWNGTAWSQAKFPNPSPAGEYQSSGFAAVSASSATSAWATGSYNPAVADSGASTLTMHWNGTKWSKVKSPQPSGKEGLLDGVSAVSATSALAVGSYSTGCCGHSVNAALQWNGSTWSKATVPAGKGYYNVLFAMSADSATDAWAVGVRRQPSGIVAVHWNGTSWSHAALPGFANPELLGVSAVSPTDAWIVGDYSGPGQVTDTLILHWNGTSWSQM